MITEEKWKQVFAERLSKRMKVVGMEQKELAMYIYMSPSTVSYYCAGKVIPSAYTLSLMAEVLTCTVAYLVGEEEE